ncbi:MAG: GNAT family N-acetyltransferase [Anaerolineae bacterium]|nr:GNAT family N-acetyltransferase [Anaerolineae bacterium]
MSEQEGLTYYERIGLVDVAGNLHEPPPGIKIRSAAEPADLSNIVDLYNAAFERLGDEVTEAEVAGYARHPGLAAPGVFLAFDGPLAVGAIVSRLDVPAPGGEARRAGVELLVVRPEYRRRGIAAALVGRILAWLASIGVETVGATVDASGRELGVATLLERYEFRQVGEKGGNE